MQLDTTLLSVIEMQIILCIFESFFQYLFILFIESTLDCIVNPLFDASACSILMLITVTVPVGIVMGLQ